MLDWRVIQLPLDDLSRLLKVKVASSTTAAGEKGKRGGAAAATAAGRQRTAAGAAASPPPSLKPSAHSGAAASPPKSAAALAAAASAAAGGMRAPSVYRGTLVVPAAAAKKSRTKGEGAEARPTALASDRDSGGNPPSTWADLSGWGKGLLFVNGVNLGYYWPSKGPQTRQYVPGPFLKTGNNEIVLVELEAGMGPAGGTLSFASEPDFSGRVMPAAGTI